MQRIRRIKPRGQPRTEEQIRALSLRVTRLKKGLTLRQVSEQTGISLSTIAALEQGMGKNFRAELKHTLADFYGKPVFVLFPEIREQVDLLLGKRRQIQMFLAKEELRKD
jgi:transcriptional regulator with XRE-family HTH domain